MDKENKNRWIHIPGFSRYQINRNTMEIMSKTKRTQRILAKNQNKIQMTDDNGVKHGLSMHRVLYASMNGINPADLPRTIVIRRDKKAGVTAVTRQELNEEIARSMKSVRTNRAIEREYQESLRIINLILESYRTHSYDKIMEEVYGKRDLVFYYLRKRFCFRDEGVMEEIWSSVFQKVTDIIIEKRGPVFSIDYTLKNVCRIFVERRRKIIGRTIQIDDPEEWGLDSYR